MRSSEAVQAIADPTEGVGVSESEIDRKVIDAGAGAPSGDAGSDAGAESGDDADVAGTHPEASSLEPADSV